MILRFEMKMKFACVVVGLFLCSACQAMTGNAQIDAPEAPINRIVIVGDSTAANYPPERAPLMGWGQALPVFTAKGVAVLNKAKNGRSTKSFIDEGLWGDVIDQIGPGDLVMIGFGHNDSRDDAPLRFAAADGAYRDNLMRFVRDVQAAGGRAIILSPAARRLWEGPAMVETHGLYALNAEIAARRSGAGFIDLANLSLAYFEAIGREDTKADFAWYTRTDQVSGETVNVEDNTHFTALGACGVAYVVAGQLMKTADADRVINVDAMEFVDTLQIAQRRPAAVIRCEKDARTLQP